MCGNRSSHLIVVGFEEMESLVDDSPQTPRFARLKAPWLPGMNNK